MSPLFPSLSDNYSEEEYESFSSEQEASDDAVQGQVLFRAWLLPERAQWSMCTPSSCLKRKAYFCI